MTYNIVVLPDSMDYLYPLPKQNLLSRFKPIFSLLNSGQSVTSQALPHSGQSSLVQFILSQTDLLTELSPHRHFIYLNPESATTQNSTNIYKLILSQIPDIQISQLLGDDFILFQTIKKKLQFPTTFVIDWFEGWDKFPQSLGLSLKSIWESGQHTPPNKINFLFLTPPLSLSSHLSPFFSSLKNPISENIINFTLLSPEEINYSVKRFAKLYGKKVDQNLITKITSYSSGIGGLIKPYLSTPNDQVKVELVYSHLLSYQELLPKESHVAKALDAFSPNQIIGNLKVSSSLSAQDLDLLRYFVAKPNILFTRDEIANMIWGKKASEKYSDWAIDKAISRLRTKLKDPKAKIITVKNAGYKLMLF